jgi:hypothetical protein
MGAYGNLPKSLFLYVCLRNILILMTAVRTVAVTPGKARSMDFNEVRRVCQDYALLGMKTIFEARANATTPFRFVYLSGVAAVRDQTKKPTFMAQYSLMRVCSSTYAPRAAFISLQ